MNSVGLIIDYPDPSWHEELDVLSGISENQPLGSSQKLLVRELTLGESNFQLLGAFCSSQNWNFGAWGRRQ